MSWQQQLSQQRSQQLTPGQALGQQLQRKAQQTRQALANGRESSAATTPVSDQGQAISREVVRQQVGPSTLCKLHQSCLLGYDCLFPACVCDLGLCLHRGVAW